jgi:hypothetical protein
MTYHTYAHASSDVKVFQARPVPVCLSVSARPSPWSTATTRATTSDSQVHVSLVWRLSETSITAATFFILLATPKVPPRGTEQAERQDKKLDLSLSQLPMAPLSSSCFSRDSARLLELAGEVSCSASSISALCW